MSCTVEFNSLIERGMFTMVPDVESSDHRIYGARFFETIRKEGKAYAFGKSRLVIKAFKDKKHRMLTYGSTVQRSLMRLPLCLCAMDTNFVFFSRDVSQAYVQSETFVRHPIFFARLRCLTFPIVLYSALTPLRTTRSRRPPVPHVPQNHRDVLNMHPSIVDPCFLYTLQKVSDNSTSSTASRGFTCLQTDNTKNVGNSSFIQLESSASSKSDCKHPFFLRMEVL